MLLSKSQLSVACQLDVDGVKAALKEGGYSKTSITGSRFLGMNLSGQFVYEIKFNDGDGEDVGRVFIVYKNIPLTGWVLEGDF